MTAQIKPPAKMGNFPAWHPGDGPTAYVFDSMPEGEKCAWSCLWMTAGGMVKPEDWGAVLDDMDAEQLKAELRDACTMLARDPYHLSSLQQALKHIELNPHARSFAISALRQARNSYREYTATWSPPTSKTAWATRPRGQWGKK